MTRASSRGKPSKPRGRRGTADANDAERAVQARLLGALLTLVSLDLGADARWEEPARTEPFERASDRSRHGVATRGDALAIVCEQCSIGEITLRLRELGLDARGTKRALAARLLDADPDFARAHLPAAANRAAEIVSGNVVLARAPDTVRPSRDVLQCLRERDLDAAIELTIAAHTAACLEASASIAWREPDYRRDMTLLLRRVFTTWPDALDDVPDAARGAYRVAACMMALSESPCRMEWIDVRGPTRSRLSGVQTAAFVLRAAQHAMRRQRWRDAGITHARIAFAHAPCPACSPLRDRVYNLRGLPALPPAGCTCDGGCSAHLIAYRKARSSARSSANILA
jgi:hypothetical protein